MIDRDSSSFPLNSQFEFKKDYLSTQQPINPPTGLDYQPINKYTSTNGLYPSSSPNYVQPASGYVAQPSTVGINKFEQNVNKSLYNNDTKTEINSQVQGSPFQLNHVKDAKSITYDKNMFSSYMGEEKGHFRTQ